MKFKHVPTKQIKKHKYNRYCNMGCGNITAASDVPFPYLIEKALDAPCSECKNPLEFLKDLYDQNTDGK